MIFNMQHAFFFVHSSLLYHLLFTNFFFHQVCCSHWWPYFSGEMGKYSHTLCGMSALWYLWVVYGLLTHDSNKCLISYFSSQLPKTYCIDCNLLVSSFVWKYSINSEYVGLCNDILVSVQHKTRLNKTI